MNDQLTPAYHAVRADFLPAERAADEASALTARLLATFLEQRAAAGLAIGTGAPLVRKLAKSLAAQLEARDEFIMAHKLAAALPREIGIDPSLYGDTEDCPPDDPRRSLLAAPAGPVPDNVVRFAAA